MFGEDLTVSRVTLKTLAADLGLTEATVSRALNDYDDIAEQTRLRVQKEALAQGYAPNPSARRLARGTAEAVAYLMPANQSGVSDSFIGQLLQGLGESLSKRKWDLLVMQAPAAEDEAETIQKLARSGTVSGVVLSRPYKVDKRIKLLQEARLPFVVHGRSSDCSDYAWYDVDNTKAFIDIVDHLVSLGHRRLGYVGAPSYLNFAHQRMQGVLQGIKYNGLSEADLLIEISEMNDLGGEQAASVMLDCDTPPTALICATDIQAIGALAALRSRGLCAGVDVSVIGYDGLFIGKHSNPPLTTMAQPLAHSGRILGDMLLALIDGAEPKSLQELRNAELVRRMSDGPARPSQNQP